MKATRRVTSKYFARHMTTSSTLVLAACAYAFPVHADVPPPTRFSVDQNGVDLARGQYRGRTQILAIGTGKGELAVSIDHTQGWPAESEYELGVYGDSTYVYVAVPEADGPVSKLFAKVGTAWSSKLGDGASLIQTGSSYVLKLNDGTELSYDASLTSSDSTRIARLTKIRHVTGEVISVVYRREIACVNQNQAQCHGSNPPVKARIESVVSSNGFQLRYHYAANYITDTSWNKLSKITAYNMADAGCDPGAYYCQYPRNWPSVTFGAGQAAGSWTVTDNLGRVSTFTNSTVRRPGSSSDNVVVVRNNLGNVSSVNLDGLAWQYAFSGATGTTTAVITNPDKTLRTVVSSLSVGLPTSVTDETGRTTSYTYDSKGRLATGTAPGGQQDRYSYDDRGNVTELRRVSATPGTPPDLVTTAGYDAVCNSGITCNKPNWIRDAKNAQTDYSYDATHGQVTVATLPADANGIRPQTRLGYSALQAIYKSGSGAITASGAPTHVLTSMSSCRAGVGCGGSADEVRTTVSYGTGTSVNNLLPTSITTGAGDATLSATVAVTYNPLGNVETRDGPSSGPADSSRRIYDAAGQLVMTIGPDPDGGGPLRSRAVRVQYTPAGLISSQSVGSANADGTGFTASLIDAVAYDVGNRVSSTTSTDAAGTVHHVTQYMYDANGRLECTAVRMNPGAYGSLPAACALGPQGSDGPDRIVRTTYDAAGRVSTVTKAHGTAEASTENRSYSPNGEVASVTDANGNVTTYGYDGFDRLATTTFPGGSNEQLTYDPNGNVVSERLRDGQVIGLTYDALGRLTRKDLPNAAAYETDQDYAYDLLGRIKRASDGSGHVLSFSYDALGRRLSEGSAWYGAKVSSYDQAGRRTRLTWRDGFFVTYEYDVAGRMTAIRENGSALLASFSYDDLGRRTSLVRGNGVTTSYGYDGALRLTSLGLDLAGTAQDQGYGFGYNAAGQITSRSATNDAYAWRGHYNVDRSYGVNGLNQLTSAGATALGYDARGNLTSSAGSSYGYTAENKMASAPGTSLIHDPMGRMFAVTGTQTILDHDGADLVLETDQSTGTQVRRRYVYGPGTDEPLVWYEGSGTGDRRFLVADERGSVVAVTDGSGAASAINSYDEYGIPGANNQGRFGYTGQKWIAELGLYDYKARMYSPTLGRFMQTDPIGYADGMNWYNYVGSDPVNSTDPSGMACIGGTVEGFAPNITCDSPGGSKLLPMDYGGNVGFFAPRRTTDAGTWELQRLGLYPVPKGSPPPEEKPQQKPKSRPKPPNKLCVFALENVGSGPAELTAGLAGGVIGNLIGSASTEATRGVLNRGPVIGSRVGAGAVAGARAGRVGGVVGAVAGGAAGIYFQDEIEDFTKKICSGD